MTREQGNRPLEFSDIGTGLNAEILKNPYQFLELPDNASFEEVRARYIVRIRLYHPDLVNAGFDPKDLAKRYAPDEIETAFNLHDIKPENRAEELETRLLKLEGVTEADVKERDRILESIRVLAHEKMVQLNTAFEAIKARTGQRQWKNLAGYDVRNIVEDDGFSYQQIFLEGAAEVNIFPRLERYYIPGPYLSFDWGPPIDHENYTWEEPDYRYNIAVKHLFVHQELQEGRHQITSVLLEPFFKIFRLKPEQQEKFTSLLLARRFASSYIRELLGLSDFKDVRQDSNAWFRSRDFEWQVNEMQTLSMFHDQWGPRISTREEEGKLIIKDFTETSLSETDMMLLSTLAYGPMLS